MHSCLKVTGNIITKFHKHLLIQSTMITGSVLSSQEICMKANGSRARAQKYTTGQLWIAGPSCCLVNWCGPNSGRLAGIQTDRWQAWTHNPACIVSRRDLVPQHVSRKIRFLRIRLTTNRADLRL